MCSHLWSLQRRLGVILRVKTSHFSLVVDDRGW